MVRLTESPTEVRIKNIGRLDDATIFISQFTVFAGPNNTGKSFVSKLLYSLFAAMSSKDLGINYLRVLAIAPYLASEATSDTL